MRACVFRSNDLISALLCSHRIFGCNVIGEKELQSDLTSSSCAPLVIVRSAVFAAAFPAPSPFAHATSK